jgi:TPR repeat protein
MSNMVEIELLAEAGDLHAQYKLGNCYRLGDGVSKDDVKATFWYRKAADQGHVYAIKCMENACRNGLGTKVNLVEAAGWKAKINRRTDTSKDSGLREAASPLHSSLDIDLLFKSLNDGEAEALYRIGVCYEEGLMLRRNLIEARAYFSIGTGINDIDARSAFRLRCIEREMTVDERNRSHKRCVKLKKEIDAGRASPLESS